MDFWFAVTPIIFLIIVMTKKRNWPSHVALPVVALIAWVIRLGWFGAEPNFTNALVVKGALSALTPISIIWGAILLATFMDKSGSQAVVNRWLNGVSGNPVAQLMLIGWAFAFMLEGASGFGTPAAIAAPILVALGFPVLRVAIFTLILNSVPVSFGAMGTPTWFGFAPLDLQEPELLAIGIRTALIHAVAGLIIPVMALVFVIDFAIVRRNLVFIYLSILSCTVPYFLLAFVSYEFPSLVGGGIGLFITVLLAHYNVGLHREDETAGPEPVSHPGQPVEQASDSPWRVARAFAPFGLLIGLLVLTRIPGLGLRALLTMDSPAVEIPMGSLGTGRISAALVLGLERIFQTGAEWSYNTLYVPALIPFVVVVLISMPIVGAGWPQVREALRIANRRLRLPAITLIGALVMVELMMTGFGEERSMTVIIGATLANLSGANWQYVASLMGALGSFFSGSASVSNLTFGAIQESIALDVGLDPVRILALQSTGAAMGNMVCINNIVAVCSILGIHNQEGHILTRTVVPLIIYACIAALMALVI